MKRLAALFLILILILSSFSTAIPLSAEEGSSESQNPFEINACSAILMEYETGTVLFEQNADEQLPPASITKIMTLLLVMEALEAGRITEDEKVVTSERAASMGGSQIYLKVGEEMSVRDMLKSVVIASANDAAAALAEHICGSLEAFVEKMNEKAAALGMENTHFENTNGLDDTTVSHYTSARDVALMSRALLAYPLILEFSGTWMDSVRDGAFGLTNTNRLVRFYPGATGLKTGSTSKAKFCISATAKRDGMHLIAVVMGSPTRDIRNEEAKKLLDYGFANYALVSDGEEDVGELSVEGGVQDLCRVRKNAFFAVIPKGDRAKLEKIVSLPPTLKAPIKKGEKIGAITYTVNGKAVGSADIYASEDVAKISLGELILRLLRECFCLTV